MPVRRMKEYLDSYGVTYRSVSHGRTFTAAQTAQTAHVPSKELAKTVMVKIDGELAMAVVPADARVDLDSLALATGSDNVTLANEREFRDRFPDCEPGAMPPLGNLWGMGVYADRELAEDEQIAFNAGTHDELMWLAWSDFARLVRPVVGNFGWRPAGAEM